MAAALLVPTSASAATFYVRSSADTAAGACPANDFTGSTACTCRGAWNSANANFGSDTIQLDVDCPLSLPGTEDNNAAGDLDAWDFNGGTTLTVELQGHTIDWASTVDDGDKDRILHVPATSGLRRPVNLVVRVGYILGGRVVNQAEGGGCIAVRGANLTLDGVNVEGCQHLRQSFVPDGPCGGGVEARSQLTIVDSFIIQNIATNSSGGGVCAFGDSTVTRTVFDGNQTVTAGHGGGFALVDTSASLGFERVELEDNTSPNEGGGIWSIGDKVTILESEVRWNVARYGAGIWLRVPSNQGSDPLLERSLLWANNASAGPGPRHGGGLYVAGGATETTLVLYNSTLSRNEADNDGGAMYLAPGSEPYKVELRRCTVFENTDVGASDNVAYITFGSPAPELTYTGSLLAGACTGGGLTTSLGQILVDSTAAFLCDGFNYNLPFTLNSTLGLGNGGFARYHDINGFSAAWGGATCSTSEVDQASASRNSTCDIGAVEEF
jgi:hypothetical protein